MINSFRIFDKISKSFENFKISDWDRVDQATGVTDKDSNMIHMGDYVYLDDFDVIQDEFSRDMFNTDEVRLIGFKDGCFTVNSLVDEEVYCNIDMINPNLTKIVGNIRTQVLTPELIAEL